MGLLRFLFGKKSTKTQEYLKKGAVILDVRTQAEYDHFHFETAIHIPISELKSRLNELKAINKPIIAHCKSGVRSAQAKQILNANGLEAINGGGISKLKSALRQ